MAKYIKDFLIHESIDCPIVIDPVFSSTTGKVFHQKEKYKKLYEIFSPLKPIFTPNFDEVMVLYNNKNDSIEKIFKKSLF